MITDDRRAFKRVRHKFVVKYDLHDAAHDAAGTAVTDNISMGGVYFLSLERMEPGQRIDCYIDMPGIRERGKWAARVVRCEPVADSMVKTYGVAVEFEKAFGNSEKNLKKILK